MIFVRDFDIDLDLAIDLLRPDFRSEPFALARFGSLEHEIIWGREHRGSSLSLSLFRALQCQLPGWRMGIVSGERDPDAHQQLLLNTKIGLSYLTFSELWLAISQEELANISIDHMLTIGPSCTIETPESPDDENWPAAVDELVPYMVNCGRTVAVSAGPWAPVILHRYWSECPVEKRQLVLDVGTPLEERSRMKLAVKVDQPHSGVRAWRPNWNPE